MSSLGDAAERALERCAADPRFESRLRAAYRGRHDVLDALWWAAHPLTDSPRGKSDPAAELRQLQNAVFSREPSASPLIDVSDARTGAVLRVRESEHRLQEMQRRLAADAAALSAALDTVDPAEASSAVSTPAEVPDWPSASRPEREIDPVPASGPVVPAHSAPSHDHQSHEEGAIPTPSRARARARRLLLPVLSGAAVLAAILILPSISGMNPGMGGAPGPSRPSLQVPRATTEIVRLGSDGTVPDPLSILERPQVETDLPPDGFAMNQADSYRKLPDLVGHVELYLAKDQENTICLVAVRIDGAGMSGCIDESQFAAQGIWLGGGERYSIGPDATILTESFSLLANGDFHYEATARVKQPYQAPR
jgi:hypothetical protein